MDSEKYRRLMEVISAPDETEKAPAYSSKKNLCDFFWNRNYSIITKVEELNEMDFIESLYKCQWRYRHIGQLGGFLLISTLWNTVLRSARPVSKFLLGGLVVYYSGELMIYTTIDQFYEPLKQVFNEAYMPYILNIPKKKTVSAH